MTEDEARAWIVERYGASRETLLDQFAVRLRTESQKQNLISAASFEQLWARHFVDSAQLIDLATDAPEGPWIDIGTGAGMPGLVVALLSERPMILVEPRGRRVEFLRECAEELGIIHRVQFEQRKIENMKPIRAAIISARAVAELSSLIGSAQHCADSSTIWLLPKGRAAQSEVEAARAKWQGSFHVEPSVTQPESGIVIARGVRSR